MALSVRNTFFAAAAALGIMASPALAGDGNIPQTTDLTQKYPTYSAQTSPKIEFQSITLSQNGPSPMTITAYGANDQRIAELRGVAAFIEERAPFDVRILKAPEKTSGMTHLDIHFKGTEIVNDLEFPNNENTQDLQKSTVLAALHGYKNYQEATGDLAMNTGASQQTAEFN
jgi:hypothetical protein